MVTGLVAVANIATAAEPVVDGHVYGWGAEGTYDPKPWTLDFPNEQAPFVDVAVDGLSWGGHTTLAVTSGGDVVAQGDYGSIATLMPASLRSQHVTAIEIFSGRAAALTQNGAIVTWANAPAPPAEYQNPSAPTGVIDVQLGGSSDSTAFGVGLKGDGTVFSWGNSGLVSRTPALTDVVQIDANNNAAFAITSQGDLYAWSTSTLPGLAGRIPDEVRNATIVDVSLNTNVAYALTDAGEVLSWSGSASGNISEDQRFPADQVDDRVVALSSSNGRGTDQTALTESGEFITWGASGSDIRKPPPVNLDAQRVVAMETASSAHTAMIFGPADQEPEPGVTSPPRVDGFPVVASELTGTPAQFNFETSNESNAWYYADAPDTPEGDWTRIGDTNPLPLTADLQGKYVVYRTQVEDPDGETWIADSTPIGPIEAQPPGVVEQPKINGIPVQNTQVTGIPATFNFPTETVVNEWYRADSADTPADQWTRVGNANPYRIVAADRDKYLVFRTTATDADGTVWTADSEPIGPIVQFTVSAASIEGEPLVGSTLTGVPGEFSYEPETVRYFWLIGGTEVVNVPEGGSLDLVLSDEHVGKTVQFYVQGSLAGLNATNFSPPTAPVEVPPLRVAEQPTINGVPVQNTQVTGIPATFNRTPASVTSEWYRADSADAPAEEWTRVSDANPYRIVAADRDKYLVFRTTATDEAGETLVSDSEPIGPIVQFTVSAASIEGEPLVGNTLTGVPGEFSYEPENVTYFWLIGGTEVINVPANGSLDLLLTEDHVGKTVQFYVQGSLAGLNATNFSPPTAPVELPPLANTSDSEISGTAKSGQTLTGTPATFNLEPDTVTHAWFTQPTEGGELTPIPDADGTELVLTDDHIGLNIVFRTTAVRGEETVDADSAPFGPIARADIPVDFSQEPTITGTPEVEQTLTGVAAEFTGDIEGQPLNEWLNAAGEVIGTGNTLALTTDHIGATVRFRTTVTEVASGEQVSSTSTPVGPVVDRFLEVGPPTIEGTPKVGQTLTGTPAEFRGGPELANVWLADGEVIEGATGTLLELTDEHEGATIAFRTVATRGDATLESTSAEVGPVAPKDDDGGVTPPPGPPTDREGGISAPDTVAPGETITVKVGENDDWAGEKVTVMLYSNPRELGTPTVGADGTFSVTIPTDVALGQHQLAVYDANGTIIGWQYITVASADDGSGPGDDSTGPGIGGRLPNAGADSSAALAPIGLAVLLAGAVTMGAAWRRRQQLIG
ncbi:hypothetical protein BHE97_07285 [Aeromicrobium sp. PE09-221]|uniref:hypothetical protein n=1 Tax=Aeromicrobium sp. PE09-221 TaxID=1898043 RepID=UPI000B3E935E|nr:hypothetical protein [Aeromicrobium sp. PE09-221]OUZ10552.1 hypothetical protein BHE97_07285 [Aeromicrobium sp. PE09-221]